MGNRYAPIAAAWIATCGAAYYWGGQSDTTQEGGDPNDSRPSMVRTSERDRSPSTPASSTSRRSLGERETLLFQLSSNDPSNQIREIVQLADPIERTEALLALIGQLSPGEFQDMVASFRDLGITRERMGEYAIMLTAWAKVDPVGALTYASENTGTPFARQTILATWAQSQPDAAIAWAQENFKPGERNEDANPWLIGIIKGLAQSDLNRATSLLEQLPYSRGRGDALDNVLRKIREQGMDTAKQWAVSLSDERLQTGAIARLASDLAEEDPIGTLDWAASVSEEAFERSARQVVERWASGDPNGARDWVDQQPENIQASTAPGLIEALSENDPQAAAEWLTQHAGNPAFDDAVRELVWNTSGRDPAMSSSWIMNLTDERDRTRTYHRALRQMMSSDAQATMGFIQNNEVPDGIRERATRYFEEQNK
ncbi:MAG: hypothetical protein ACON5H_00250 [Akkermansiaceae bacterium]